MPETVDDEGDDAGDDDASVAVNEYTDPPRVHPLLHVDPAASSLFQLLTAHSLEGAVLWRRFEDLLVRTIERIFGNRDSKAMPEFYDFLKLHTLADLVSEVLMPYYMEDQASISPAFKEAQRRLQCAVDDTEMLAALGALSGHTLTVGDAFLTRMNGGPRMIAPEFFSPLSYYPARLLNRTTITAATAAANDWRPPSKLYAPADGDAMDLDHDDGLDRDAGPVDRHTWAEWCLTLRHRAAAELFTVDSVPVPEQFPRAELVFSLHDKKECFPELLMEQPLPLMLGQNATTDVGVLVVQNMQLYQRIPGQIIAAYDARIRSSHGPVAAQQEQYANVLTADLLAVFNGDPENAANGESGIHATTAETTSMQMLREMLTRQQAEDDAITEARRHELAHEIDQVTDYIELRQVNERRMVSERRQEFVSGAYPGALSCWTDNHSAAQRRETEATRRLMALGESLNQGEEVDPEAAAARADRFSAGSAAMPTPMIGDDDDPDDPGAYLEKHGRTDPEARQLAEQKRPFAGSWGLRSAPPPPSIDAPCRHHQ